MIGIVNTGTIKQDSRHTYHYLLHVPYHYRSTIIIMIIVSAMDTSIICTSARIRFTTIITTVGWHYYGKR